MTSLRGALLTFALALPAALASGCSSSPPIVSMVASPDNPAAEGRVQATTGSNENTRLHVEVRHLARPEKMTPGATTYVVWVKPADGGQPQNLGALQINADLYGTLTTVTPLRKFDVFITAEPAPTVTAPGSKTLLSASVSR